MFDELADFNNNNNNNQNLIVKSGMRERNVIYIHILHLNGKNIHIFKWKEQL